MVVLSTAPSGSMLFKCTSCKLALRVTDFFIIFIVPTFDVNIIPFGPIDDGVVGRPKEIHCTVSAVSGVELSSVLISWMGPGGNVIANDSRVTVSPITSLVNDFISTLEFVYLMEGDEGIYTCDVMILETKGSDFIEISNLTGEQI